MDWREEEKKKNGGWTLWKEILGTAIGLLPIAVTVAVGLLSWGSKLEISLARQDQRISSLEIQRSEIQTALTRISDKLDVISQQVARDNGELLRR